MKKTCTSCGVSFQAKRAAAKYCGERCKKRAQRKPGGVRGIKGAVVALPALSQPDSDSEAAAALIGTGDALTQATRRSLEAADRVDTELGAAVLLMARRLDYVGPVETGSGVAALMKEYRATLAEALKDVEAADDELDQIRGSAALKLLQGGRAG